MVTLMGRILTDPGTSFFCQVYCHEQRASYPWPSWETCLTRGFSALAKLTRVAGWSFDVGVVQLTVEHKQLLWPLSAECWQHPQSCDNPHVSGHCHLSSGGQKCSCLRATGLTPKNSLEILYSFCTCLLSLCSHARFFATLWTVACQAPLSVEFSRQEYWSGLPCPSPGDLPDPGIEPASVSLALTGGFFTTSATWGASSYIA